MAKGTGIYFVMHSMFSSIGLPAVPKDKHYALKVDSQTRCYFVHGSNDWAGRPLVINMHGFLPPSAYNHLQPQTLLSPNLGKILNP